MIGYILFCLWFWAIYRCLFACPGDEDPYMEAIIKAFEDGLGHPLDELDKSISKNKAAQ
jgi:hypothetical protein